MRPTEYFVCALMKRAGYIVREVRLHTESYEAASAEELKLKALGHKTVVITVFA